MYLTVFYCALWCYIVLYSAIGAPPKGTGPAVLFTDAKLSFKGFEGIVFFIYEPFI